MMQKLIKMTGQYNGYTLKVAINNNTAIISGDTRPVKHIIKSKGAKWDWNTSTWSIDVDELAGINELMGWEMIDDIKEEIKSTERVTLPSDDAPQYKASLKIEAIGDGENQLLRRFSSLTGIHHPRYWVAHIIGLDQKYKFKREFMRGKKDYRSANSTGSRGVYVYYLLDDGEVYEVKSPESWGRNDRYYCRVSGGEIIRIKEEEVIQWISAR